MLGHGVAPGTCGELVQGVTSAGEHVNVACPIAVYATVEARVSPAAATRVTGAGAERAKMVLAARRTLASLQARPHTVHLRHGSDLEVGKGLGSSTADITATVRAVADGLGRPVAPEQIAAIATSIEASDGTMFPGGDAMDRDTGRIVRRFVWAPTFVVAMVVPPTTIDTGSVDVSGKAGLASEYDAMLDRLEVAARARDARSFAVEATRSAAMNQAFVPNANHDRLVSMVPGSGALGVVVGHTGTVAGLLFPADDDGPAAAAAAAADLRAALTDSTRVEVVRTLAGST
jgi:L-threonine kinase